MFEAFVKNRAFQLHDYRHFLFFRSRLHQKRGAIRRILAGAIERLLDREHIPGRLQRLAMKRNHRGIRIVGVVQQDVPLSQALE